MCILTGEFVALILACLKYDTVMLKSQDILNQGKKVFSFISGLLRGGFYDEVNMPCIKNNIK